MPSNKTGVRKSAVKSVQIAPLRLTATSRSRLCSSQLFFALIIRQQYTSIEDNREAIWWENVLKKILTSLHFLWKFVSSFNRKPTKIPSSHYTDSLESFSIFILTTFVPTRKCLIENVMAYILSIYSFVSRNASGLKFYYIWGEYVHLVPSSDYMFVRVIEWFLWTVARSFAHCCL